MSTTNKTQTTEPQATQGKLPFWRQIGWNLAFGFAVLAIIPVAITTLVVTPQLTKNEETKTIGQLSSVVELKSDQINQWLTGSSNALQLITVDKAISEPLIALTEAEKPEANPELNQTLSDAVEAYPSLEEVFVYNTKGKVVASSNALNLGKLANLQPYFSQSFDGEQAYQIYPPFYEIGTNKLVVSVTIPMKNADNVVTGVMVGKLDITTLGDVMGQRAGLPDSGETLLVSEQNNYLLTPSRFSGYSLTRAYHSEDIDKALNGENGAGRYDDYRGVPVIGVYRWLPELEVALIAKVDQEEALAASNDARDTSIRLAGVAMLIAAFVGFLYALYMTSPIINLTRAAFAVTQGDYTQRVAITRKNEIGQLGGAFNSMTSELQRNIEQLEARVASRTRDLQVASEVSRQVTQVLERQNLLSEFVDSTKASFNLYHVSVFTYDETAQQLVLEAGAGSVGQAMLALGKQFNLDEQGLVPLAGRQKQAVVIGDVTAEANYFANPLLPHTHTEVAIPMTIGDTLIGVLDLQAVEVNRFSADDLKVMQTLAEQIAIAIRNAQLYQEAQDARDDAERANSVKSSFLAAVSHELRTPLNAIINFTGFILKGRMGATTPKQEESLKIVMDSGKHLLNLINDVLDISKIESGSLELFVEENIDLRKELNTALEAGQTLLDEKPVQLVVDVEANLPLIMGDRQRILQVFLNVLSNACKFTEEGSITVSAKQCTDEIQISVKDTGPGIDPEEHDAVFESFRQTQTGLRQGGGTGLGMPISKKLAEAHGGRLWVESQKGAGATFHIALPIHSAILKPSLS